MTTKLDIHTQNQLVKTLRFLEQLEDKYLEKYQYDTSHTQRLKVSYEVDKYQYNVNVDNFVEILRENITSKEISGCDITIENVHEVTWTPHRYYIKGKVYIDMVWNPPYNFIHHARDITISSHGIMLIIGPVDFIIQLKYSDTIIRYLFEHCANTHFRLVNDVKTSDNWSVLNNNNNKLTINKITYCNKSLFYRIYESITRLTINRPIGEIYYLTFPNLTSLIAPARCIKQSRLRNFLNRHPNLCTLYLQGDSSSRDIHMILIKNQTITNLRLDSINMFDFTKMLYTNQTLTILQVNKTFENQIIIPKNKQISKNLLCVHAFDIPINIETFEKIIESNIIYFKRIDFDDDIIRELLNKYPENPVVAHLNKELPESKRILNKKRTLQYILDPYETCVTQTYN